MNNNTNYFKALGLFVSFFALFALFSNSASAADCGNDPVYERDWSGQTDIGSRVRDWACMEDSEVLTVLPAGTQVHIIGETDGWYKVNVGEKTGWVGARLISVTSKDGGSASITTTNEEPASKTTSASAEVIGIDEANFAKLEAGDRGLRNRLAGMVVLRVHFHGKAYLVNDDGELTNLTAEEVKAIREGKSADQKLAQKVEKKVEAEKEKSETTVAAVKLRKLIGIDEANFTKLEDGDLTLRERLSDQIVLRVHYHGKAYWVNPAGGLKFLEPGDIGYYLTKNLTEENSKEEKENTDKEELPAVSGSITLEGQLTDPGKVKLTWSTSELDASKGFKAVISEDENPVYPGDKYHYLTNPATRQDYWSSLADGKTYHFRVCQYLGSKCGVYSNDIAINVETNGAFAENVMPGSIDLVVTPVADGKAEISWSLTDMTSPKGFKVVISEDENPVYPGDDYHYYSDPETRTDTWKGLESSETYHFRVCEYLGGYCGTYSNDVAVTAL